MGITWIIGVLVLEVEALLPVAYIFTIMVAFQGLAIFIVFVVFSKQVREVVKKWWKVKLNESKVLNTYFFGHLTFGSVSLPIASKRPSKVFMPQCKIASYIILAT